MATKRLRFSTERSPRAYWQDKRRAYIRNNQKQRKDFIDLLKQQAASQGTLRSFIANKTTEISASITVNVKQDLGNGKLQKTVERQSHWAGRHEELINQIKLNF